MSKKKKSAEDVTAGAKLVRKDAAVKREARSPRAKKANPVKPHRFAASPSPKNKGYEPLPPSPDMKEIKERAR